MGKYMILFGMVMWLIWSTNMAYMFCICGLFGLLQVHSHYVKPINGPNLWVKTAKGIVLALDFKKKRG